MVLESNEKGFFVPRADIAIVEDYRKHMIALFGNTDLPAVRYKGEVVPVRKL